MDATSSKTGLQSALERLRVLCEQPRSPEEQRRAEVAYNRITERDREARAVERKARASGKPDRVAEFRQAAQAAGTSEEAFARAVVRALCGFLGYAPAEGFVGEVRRMLRQYRSVHVFNATLDILRYDASKVDDPWRLLEIKARRLSDLKG